jgi:hypothetical protein
MVKPKIEQMKRKELEAELARARALITDINAHMSHAVAFYGYMASVEDLVKANYALQRRMQVFLEEPPRDLLIEWLGELTELLRSSRGGLHPGEEPAIDKVCLFLGYDRWEKQHKERLGAT